MTDNWKPLFPLAGLQEGSMRACAVDGRELVHEIDSAQAPTKVLLDILSIVQSLPR